MSEPFVGEIRVFPYLRGVPQGWLLCDGNVYSASDYSALSNVLGTTFGGDGNSGTFAVPNLQGGVMLHQGQLAGGQLYPFAQSGGAAQVTLTSSQLPTHSHALNAVSSPTSATATPGSSTLVADAGSSAPMYASDAATYVQLAPGSIGPTGGSAAHSNMQPVLALRHCIAWQGVFPSRAS